jgi:hypothetical protein
LVSGSLPYLFFFFHFQEINLALWESPHSGERPWALFVWGRNRGPESELPCFFPSGVSWPGSPGKENWLPRAWVQQREG